MRMGREGGSSRVMYVYEKAFNRIVALAIVKQQELAVASSAIAERENEEVGVKNVKGGREGHARADASFVKFVNNLPRRK
jgi:hypothetical protein